ncbi:MAG: DUF1565 domain-containing protein [Phycisphaerae bacterium]|nr:DUF1565 domain-containing protein [Phycisphaerae bacterium]
MGEYSGTSDDPNQFVNISETNIAGGSGIELGEIKNLNLDFDFGASVDSLGFSFYQGKTNLNLYVNGEMVYFDDFQQLNDITVGGAAVSVTLNDPNQGQLELTGTIYSFKVGGEQLWIDDMAVTPAGITTYYVDVDGNDSNPGLNKESAFATITKAISTARPNEIVAVYPGTYNESFSFIGKPLTLQAVTDPPVIQTPGVIAVSFTAGDGKDTIMQNFIIENCGTAIFCLAGTPTIRNITVANNDFGITAHESSKPNIYNCIFWNNTNGDVAGCDVSYCCSQQLLPGLGNISTDPMFVRPAEVDDNFTPNDPNDDIFVSGDYHLKSSGWRWSESPMHGSNWYFDDDGTSRCIDAGIPSYGLNSEPLTISLDPENQWAANIRVNMGAYGGTATASMAPHGHAFLADINNDGFVNGNDLFVIAGQWLESDLFLPADLSRDSYVNLYDFSLFASEWGKMNEWARNISLTEYWPMDLYSRWESDVVEGIGFVLLVTDTFVVNGIKVWEFTNTHHTSEGLVKQVENRFYLGGVLYSVQDPNQLQTLPAQSENYKPLFMQSMVSGTPYELEDSTELTPVRGSLASVLINSDLTLEDFPNRGKNDVLALFEDYGLPSQKIIAIFAKGSGPLYIAYDFTEQRIIREFFRIEL